MDFIVSYYLYNNIKKNELKGSLREPIRVEKKQEQIKIHNNDQSTRDIISKTCGKCGQEPYFCQCSNNMKLMYHNFNPEKDNY
jgi:hypothetical protein